MNTLLSVTLTLEEVEAIRLKDIGDLHQEECAGQMGVSRATFHQILKSAHAKLADAIVNGKAIRVEGGTVAFPGGRFRCRNDGHEWILPPGPLPGATSLACPTCQSRDVQPVFPPGRHGHGGHGPVRGGVRGWGGGQEGFAREAMPDGGPETGPRGGRGRRGGRRQ